MVMLDRNFLHEQTAYLTWANVEEQGSHRLEKYLNIQDCLEKSLKINLP